LLARRAFLRAYLAAEALKALDECIGLLPSCDTNRRQFERYFCLYRRHRPPKAAKVIEQLKVVQPSLVGQEGGNSYVRRTNVGIHNGCVTIREMEMMKR
jgi:hypothetical protein